VPGIAYRNPRDRTQRAVGLSTIVHGIGSRKDIEPNLQIDAGKKITAVSGTSLSIRSGAFCGRDRLGGLNRQYAQVT
jgi:hypothetical protein